MVVHQSIATSRCHEIVIFQTGVNFPFFFPQPLENVPRWRYSFSISRGHPSACFYFPSSNKFTKMPAVAITSRNRTFSYKVSLLKTRWPFFFFFHPPVHGCKRSSDETRGVMPSKKIHRPKDLSSIVGYTWNTGLGIEQGRFFFVSKHRGGEERKIYLTTSSSKNTELFTDTKREKRRKRVLGALARATWRTSTDLQTYIYRGRLTLRQPHPFLYNPDSTTPFSYSSHRGTSEGSLFSGSPRNAYFTAARHKAAIFQWA